MARDQIRLSLGEGREGEGRGEPSATAGRVVRFGGKERERDRREEIKPCETKALQLPDTKISWMELIPHLNTSLRQRRLGRQSLPRRHARIVRSFEFLLELLQLFRAERGAISPEFRLLRPVQAPFVPVTVCAEKPPLVFPPHFYPRSRKWKRQSPCK